MEKDMSKIVELYRTAELGLQKSGEPEIPMHIGPRQLAIEAGKITMIVEFTYLVLDSRHGLKGRELKNFMSKFESLDREELLDALQVPEDEFMRILNQVVECIGCRRIIERVFRQFKKNGSRTLDPLWITEEGVVRIRQEHLEGSSPLDLCKLLQKSVFLFAGLCSFKQRTKQSIRCTIHNLDAYKVTPFSETWIDIWTSMKWQCREKILIIEMADLQTTLDIYLKKHKFCHECSAKVETAFHLLFKEKNPKKEPGYSEELYAGIKRCLNKHIQLPCKVDFIDTLIRRAEPELVGNGNRQRERHAKTLEIAQEEVLTCIGMCIFERFRKIYNARKEEEGACQLLAVLALHGMYRSFDLAVEEKRGISNLELLYEEISQQEQRQEQRKEQKRLKKRQKKMEKRSLCTNCKHSHKKEVVGEDEEDEPSIHEDEEEEEEDFDDNDFVEEMIKVASKSRNNKNNHLHPSSQQTKAPNHNNHNIKKTGTNSTKQAQPTIQSGKKANPRGTKDPISYPLKQNNNKVVSSPTVVVNQIRQKQQSTLDPEIDILCHTCKVGGDNDNDLENEILKRKMRSQPISVDCGYVSDQLSLTNCSSTSSSSLEEQMEGKRSALVNNVDLEEEEEIVLPCGGGKSSGSSVAPCSSPLTINSQLSSLSSSPEGSEVACQEGLCNHQAMEIAVSDHPVQQQRSSVNNNNNNSSYIPEELINEFRSKHSNLKASREELRKNLRQSFAQFCLKNKNRSLSHLCRTGRCLDNAGDEGMCSGQCE